MNKVCKNCCTPYRPTSGHNLYCRACARAARCRICRKVLPGRGWQCQACYDAAAIIRTIRRENCGRVPRDPALHERMLAHYAKRAAAGLPLFD